MAYNPLPIFCTIKPSFIDGLGLFATREIKKDTELGISHIEVDEILYRLPLGAFINHDKQSNCVRTKVNNKWYLKTTKDIMPNDELTLTYSLYNPE
jgi:SET domain-containing protein